MTPEEQRIIVKERKQIKGFLEAIRTENNTISKELSGLVAKIAKLRGAEVAIELILQEFEKKLKC